MNTNWLLFRKRSRLNSNLEYQPEAQLCRIFPLLTIQVKNGKSSQFLTRVKGVVSVLTRLRNWLRKELLKTLVLGLPQLGFAKLEALSLLKTNQRKRNTSTSWRALVKSLLQRTTLFWLARRVKLALIPLKSRILQTRLWHMTSGQICKTLWEQKLSA